MAFLAALDVSDASLGGKARSLARLAAAGLATPPGFAITDALFRAMCPSTIELAAFDETALQSLARWRAETERAAWPAGFAAALRSMLGGLGADRFSVRSSFMSEDRVGAVAAGVYESRIDVGASEVEGAIRSVLGSAFSPGAAAYAKAHGQSPTEGPCAVLIHVYMSGRAEGSSAFAPGAMPEPVVMLRRGSLPPDARADLQNSTRKLAQAMGAVEVEWVLQRHGPVYLQARPFQAAPAPVSWPGWQDLPDEQESAQWRWDAAHNPLPLSPAQAGLVEFVDGCCRIGVRQRVLGGYLFYAPDERPPSSGIEPPAAARYFAAIQSDFESRQAALAPTPRLEEALELFAAVYERIFGVLQPSIKRARSALPDYLRAHARGRLALLPALTADVISIAGERRQLAETIRQAATEDERTAAQAAYLSRFGDESPIWDVFHPTYAEEPSQLWLSTSPSSGSSPMKSPSAHLSCRPASLDWRAASSTVESGLAENERARWRRILALAREAVALAEADDWLYARAQALVRRALLAIGQRLQSAGQLADAGEIFFLPLDLARQLDRGFYPVADLARATTAGRAAWQAARRNPPPSSTPAGEDDAIGGYGTGGRTVGRISRHQAGPLGSGGPEPREDAIVLARTLLPTELPLISAAGIVTETGGPLDHVAAQARERGIPAVVGATGALNAFRDGDLVLVDGERGLVVKLDRA
jgi:pyruvate,water dikinase